jgi:hypothetical protein
MTNSKLAAARVAWSPAKMAEQYDDVRLKMLCYAILAPNPHNIQPWSVELSGTDAINLYVDPKRLLLMTDPFLRQIFEGQGTFLETLSIAAKEFGYEPNIQLFPERVDPPENIGKSPVAVVKLSKREIDNDSLFRQIPKRCNNRRPYKGPPLTENELNSLQNSYEAAGYPMVFITDAAIRDRVEDLMTEAMRVETYLDRTHEETVKMIRFNDNEVIASRDGFSYENMGVTGISRFFVERLSPRNKAFGGFFRETTVNSTHKQAHTAGAIGILFGPGNSRMDQVEVGRRFARAFLKAAELNLDIHPMNQILQEYDELAEVREKFSTIIQSLQPNSVLPTVDKVTGVTTAQLLFRVGRAEPTPHAPRRDLMDFLKS